MSLTSGCPCNELVGTGRGDKTTVGLCLITLHSSHQSSYLSTFGLQNKVLKVVLLKFTDCLRANRTLCCQHTPRGDHLRLPVNVNQPHDAMSEAAWLETILLVVIQTMWTAVSCSIAIPSESQCLQSR